jgi:hypothetical protein
MYSSMDEYVGYFYFLATMNKSAAINMHVLVSVWIVFSSLGHIPRIRIAVLHGNSMFIFWTNCKTSAQWLYYFVFSLAAQKGSSVFTPSLTLF